MNKSEDSRATKRQRPNPFGGRPIDRSQSRCAATAEDRRSGQESLILKTILAAAVLLVAYLAATPADAAEFVRKSAVKGGPDVITITGEILKDDDKKFYEIVYGLKDVSIVVNSKGGRIQAAARIGVYIRQKNWETRLLNRSVCNSACTLIFLAGTYRYMD